MKDFLVASLFITSLILVYLGLKQAGKAKGVSGALMGSNEIDLFGKTKERGYDRLITVLTYIFAFIFIMLALLVKKYVA